MANKTAAWGLSLAFLTAIAAGTAVAMGVIPVGALPQRLEEVRETVTSKAREFAKTLSSNVGTDGPSDVTKKAPEVILKEPVNDIAQTDSDEPPKPIINAPKSEADTAPIGIPAFDVFRVEKNGSALATGKTTPDTSIELITSGGNVLAKTTSNPGGEFVLLPVKPISSGDHIFKLQTKESDGTITTSEEAGLVRMPDVAGGDVLVVVTKDDPVKVMDAWPQRSTVSDNEKPDESADTGKVAGNGEPQKMVEQPKNAGQKGKSAEGDVSLVKLKQPETDQSLPKPKQSPLVAQLQADVMVKAVEASHGNIFIAGEVKSGAFVQLYVDNKPIGVAQGTGENRFFLRAPHDLSKGKHLIRADLIDPTNGSVLGRAEVPLTHKFSAGDGITAPQDKAAESKQDIECIDTCAPPIETGKSLIVRPGDNLWSVAKRALGTGHGYRQIYEANRDQISDPNNIAVGQTFQIPQSMSN